MDLYFKNKVNSIKAIMNTLEFFCGNTGLKINYDKTTIYRVGKKRFTSPLAKDYSLTKMNIEKEKINVLGIWVTYDKKDMLDLNYKEIIGKIESILNSWENRNISLIGKVMVVNSLIGSLLVYKMYVLPSLTSGIIKKLDNLVTKYLWNGRKPKIALETLQNSTTYGGLKLVNFKTKEESLKACWIQYLDQNPYLAEIAYTNLCPTLRQEIWKCNISSKDIMKTFTDSFWREVLLAWEKLNYVPKENINTSSQMATQVIWYNSNIKVEDKPFMYERAYKQGLCTLSQLFNSNNQLLTNAELSKKYKMSMMQCNSLFAAIPKAWMKVLKQSLDNNKINEEYLSEKFIKMVKPASFYYNQCIQKEYLCFKVYAKWQSALHTTLSYDEFLSLFKKIKRYTTNSKLRSFQYRLLHRAIILNKQLYCWKITENELCFYCKETVETIEHFFANCNKAKKAYKLALNFATVELNLEISNIDLSPTAILFNTVSESNVINFLILVTKGFLYTNRCLKKDFQENMLKREFVNKKSIEYYNAKIEGKLSKFYQRWYDIKTPENLTLDYINEAEDYAQNYLLEILQNEY